MRIPFFKYCITLLLLTANVLTVSSQSKGVVEIDKAINEENFDRADDILKPIIENYFAESKADSLVNYIFYVGEIEQKKFGLDAAVKRLKSFTEKINKLANGPATLRQACLEMSEFYGSVGLNKQGYESNLQALKHTMAMVNKTGNDLGLVENNLSTFAQRLGKLNLIEQHSRKAIKYILSAKKPDYITLYNAYKGLGNSMWYASKSDSALHFYNLALQTLSKAKPSPLNQFYRPATMQNNLAALYHMQGNTTRAIAAMKSCINNLKKFLATKEPNLKKASAVSFQFQAIDNLAGIYKELGDFRKARKLLEYSYQQKQKQLPGSHPAIFISEILLGQLYYAIGDNDKSIEYLHKGLQKISGNGTQYTLWEAEACNTLSLLYDHKKQIKKATYYYERTDSLYNETLQGDYDNIYLNFLRNAALFYAENNQPEIAIKKANKGFNYVAKVQGGHSLPAFYQLLNLAEVYFLSGNYEVSLEYSNKSLEVVDEKIKSSNNILDSIQMELKKPKAILQKGKAKYQLLSKKDEKGLFPILSEMNTALTILERQKSILTNPEDVGLLVADHADLLEFIKKLNWELYKITDDEAYISSIVSLHESALYNRIRARLDKNDSLQFTNVPKNVISKEQQLKTAISHSLEGNGTHDEKIHRYLAAIEKRNQFRESVRKKAPKYYNLRYASIFKSLDEIQGNIPSETTLVRYFFIEKKLFALVADNSNEEIFPLEIKSLQADINNFQQYGMDINKVADALYSLCRQLWAPIAKSINNKKVRIVPDGILYNISFEMLTPKKIQSFSELATHSLLAGLTISYHYSLFLLQNHQNTPAPEKGFVAFVPGFFDRLKNNYRSISTDSMETDFGYLSLLPQPFSIDLAKNISKLLGGKAYLNEQSTKDFFIENAGDHQIIHIGTHAESNNIHPELSRLIFAKNTISKDENNSLFVDEIYNCKLYSSLTVLTACESGKPGYQDGEGMISLAHAFNYAGSKSILTGLWKIDEQASAIIINHFYKFLLKGLPKDEALKKAKLAYLKNAEGRMLAPQYWAGLVIMGDTSPVILEQNNTAIYFIIIGAFVLILIGAYLLKKRIIPNNTNVEQPII